MQEIASKAGLDESTVDEVYTDTSMFNAEDIVRNIEEAARQLEAEEALGKIDAKRRLEIMREQKRLEADLQDIDDFDFDD